LRISFRLRLKAAQGGMGMGSGIEFFARVDKRPGLAVILDALKWDQDGLVAVVAQDAANKEVLGVAFADRVALEKTFETGLMHYYSRSRKKLWLKGEESGHVQKLVEMRVDCDGDAVLAQVNQVKGNCHLGFRSCFSYKLVRQTDGQWAIVEAGRKVFDPEQVYKRK
jgi:phosphoribosyl-AMP cyclohydrolase